MGLIEGKKEIGDWGIGIRVWRVVVSSPFPIPSSLFPLLFFLYLSAFSPIFAQNTVSLAAETARLERLSLGGQTSQERYNALFSLARLHQLSGNSLEAIKCLDGALAVTPGDSRVLFEKGKLFISLGEYEKAVEVATVLLAKGGEREYLLLGRFLIAQLEAFRSGDVFTLAALASESDFSEYLSGIYYTIWKLGGLSVWRTKLTTEFPLSPEARIAGSKAVPAPTPLWLLFPGREGVHSAATGGAAPAVPRPDAALSGAVPASPKIPLADNGATARQTSFLQAGLFSSEGNARAHAERIKNAGFQSQVQKRLVNGSDYWAVIISGGSDINGTIKRLKDAGFDSFPVNP